MQISLEFTGVSSNRKYPKIEVSVNDLILGDFDIVDNSFVDVEIPDSILFDTNSLKVRYVNKTEKDTKVANGKIVEDQFLELHRCWVDNILCEPWFLTESHYYPQYFQGFLDFCPNPEYKIKSQLIWHFPGYVELFFPRDFWNWYSFERRKYALKAHTDKDIERWENYTGNFELHKDVIDDIRKLIND
jgi:hypothetical protein